MLKNPKKEYTKDVLLATKKYIALNGKVGIKNTAPKSVEQIIQSIYRNQSKVLNQLITEEKTIRTILTAGGFTEKQYLVLNKINARYVERDTRKGY